MPVGILTKFWSDKGFGFIGPEDGGAHVFAHVRQQLQWQEQRSSVTRGTKVSYVAVLDQKYGKPKALTWTILDHGADLPAAPFGTGSHHAPAPPGTFAYTPPAGYSAPFGVHGASAPSGPLAYTPPAWYGAPPGVHGASGYGTPAVPEVEAPVNPWAAPIADPSPGKASLGNSEDIKAKLLSLPASLREHLVGQDHAITAVSNMMNMSYTGLREARGPLGTLLFVGPTGVGKTELAKALAHTMFGSELKLFRVDMAALKHRSDVSTLIGSPRGYADSGKGGTLTGFFKGLQKESLKDGGGAVVLLDEVEKAHYEVIDVFLPVFDEGYLIDGHGDRYSCENVLFIMTSNLGSHALADALSRTQAELSPDLVEKLVKPYVRQHMRPELMGRVDGMICFVPLGSEQVRAIVELQLSNLRDRILVRTDERISLTWLDSVPDFLSDASSVPEHGARGIKLVLQSSVMIPLSNLLLQLTPLSDGLKASIQIGFEDGLLTACVLPISKL